MFLNTNPDHVATYVDLDASCSCGWVEHHNTRHDALHAAGRHHAQSLRRMSAPGAGVGLLRIPQRDRPSGLTAAERLAYQKGWDRAAAKFVKGNGPASRRVGNGVDLAAATRAHYEEREPIAHKAGMSALNSYRRKSGITVPKATRRKAPTLSNCPNCGHDLRAAS